MRLQVKIHFLQDREWSSVIRESALERDQLANRTLSVHES